VFLGANNLIVGSNNLSTPFSGLIQDGGIAAARAARSPKLAPARSPSLVRIPTGRHNHPKMGNFGHHEPGLRYWNGCRSSQMRAHRRAPRRGLFERPGRSSEAHRLTVRNHENGRQNVGSRRWTAIATGG